MKVRWLSYLPNVAVVCFRFVRVRGPVLLAVWERVVVLPGPAWANGWGGEQVRSGCATVQLPRVH